MNNVDLSSLSLLPDTIKIYDINSIDFGFEHIKKTIYFSNLTENIVKIIPKNKPNINDEIKSCKFLNSLQNKTQCFVQTYGYFISSNVPDDFSDERDNAYVYLFMEQCEAPFEDLPDDERINENFFWEILIALYFARKEGSFSHRDIHPGNLMFNQLDTSSTKTYIIDGIPVQLHNVSYEPKLIDYGKSKVVKEGQDWKNIFRSYSHSDIYHLSRIFTARKITEKLKTFLLKQIEEKFAPGYYRRNAPGLDYGANFENISNLIRLYFQDQNVTCSVCQIGLAKYHDTKTVFCSKKCQLKTTFNAL